MLNIDADPKNANWIQIQDRKRHAEAEARKQRGKKPGTEGRTQQDRKEPPSEK